MTKNIEFKITRDDLSPWFKKHFDDIGLDGAYEPAVEAMKDVMLDWQKIAGGGGENRDDGAPVDTGLLRSSGSVGVQGEFLAKTPNVTKGGQKPDIVKSFTKNAEFQVLGQIGFNTEYAAKVHETFVPGGPVQPKIAGRGKFLELTLIENKKKWVRFISEKVKKALLSKPA